MFDMTNLATIAAAFFVAAASPGPATIAVASVAASAGRRAGLLFGLGLSFGLAFWGLIAATGLGAVLQASVHALVVLKVIGGLYLLWLAFNSARSATAGSSGHIDAMSHKQNFARGLMLNLSNPKAVFAWMAVLTLGMNGGNAVADLTAATGLCVILGFCIYATYALIFSTAGAMAVYRRARRWIEGAASILFALAGFGLLRSAFERR